MSKKTLIVVDHINDFVHDEGFLIPGKPAQAVIEKYFNTVFSLTYDRRCNL